MIGLYELYYNFFLSQKKIKKIFIIGSIAHDGYFLINTLLNEIPIDIDTIGMPWIYFLIFLAATKLFHKWFGQYWILKLQTWQTKEFQKYVMDKNIKAAGKRGGFKDTSQSGIASNFCVCSKEKINELMDEMTVHLYMFDLKRINEFIKSDLGIFNVAGKKAKRENFTKSITENSLFLKPMHAHLVEEIMNDYETTKKKIAISSSKYIISDSVNHKHIITMLYDYMYYTWRLELDIWVITNQPYFQYYDYKTKEYKMAKIYTPDFKATKNRTVKVKEGNRQVEYICLEYMLAEDFILFWESEADIWWNNIDGNIKQNIQERGMRWFEVAQRHIMGENVMSLRNGQVAGRTVKIQRDLEESFYTVTRCIKVNGGAKRIWIINLLLKVFKPVFHFKKEWKSYLVKKISQLKMEGWLKLETVFSRSESINYQASSVSLSALLDRENPLYMSQYQTTLVFNIRDCWGKYNTHYLEYIAEEITANSQATLMDLEEWDPGLQLHKEHIIAMNYDTVDLFNISQEERYINNPRYKKVEKENKNTMRLE